MADRYLWDMTFLALNIMIDSLQSAYSYIYEKYDFLDTVKAAPHECVISTGQP